MRITFEMSGGYGGLFALHPLSWRADTNELLEPVREKLLALVESSGILKLDPTERSLGPSSRPDVYGYRLTIAHEGGTPSFSFDDSTVPSAVRPLLQYLQQRAVEERMKR